jgi:hypothetical protein
MINQHGCQPEKVLLMLVAAKAPHNAELEFFFFPSNYSKIQGWE